MMQFCSTAQHGAGNETNDTLSISLPVNKNPCGLAGQHSNRLKLQQAGLLQLTRRPVPSHRFISVTNLGPVPLGYQIRASFHDDLSLVPCPQPSPHIGPCSNPLSSSSGAPQRGTCVQGSTRACECYPGWGDYGCNVAVKSMKNGDSLTFALPPRTWAYVSAYVRASFSS